MGKPKPNASASHSGKARPSKPAVQPKAGNARKVTEARVNAGYERGMRAQGPKPYVSPAERAKTRKRAM